MMKSSIKYIAALMMLAVTLPAMAQKDKVVEASRKERPSWIGTFNQSSITVTEVGPELSKVSEKALSSIYQHIINSIAVNITSNEKLLSKSVSYDNIHSVMSDYTSVLMSEAAKIPFISNISLTNATDIYWEKIYSRKDNSYRYEYSVQYPFDDITRRNLVAEFVAIDNAKMNELKTLQEGLKTFTNLDDIGRVVNSLDVLYSYFFDSTRRNETEALKRNYLALYSQIHIEIESERSGECIFALRLDDRNVTTSVPARLRSESALNMSVAPIEGNRYVLRYDASYASTRDINTIEIIYLFGARRVEKTIHFNAPHKK